MTIAPTLQKYMDEHGIRYDLVPHELTLLALESAHAGHISGDQLAKGVVLRDRGLQARCSPGFASSPSDGSQDGAWPGHPLGQ